MISPLAQVVIDKGVTPRDRVGSIILHTTGSGVVANAQKAGKDPEAFAVAHYKNGTEYPHYLIGHSGTIYSFGDEMKYAAHAAWKAWEREAYQDGTWQKKFAKDYQDNVVAVDTAFYQAWRDRWQGRGLNYASPRDLLRQVGNDTSPNKNSIGVEILDLKPFNEAQLKSLAALFVDVCRRHSLLDPTTITATSLPQAWLCGHSDVGPCRRWASRAGVGRGWDPAPENLDWLTLGNLIVEAAKSS